MKNSNEKLMLVILKTLGIIVCVLVTIILIAMSALLYFENHDFSDRNGIDKKVFSCHRGDLKIRGTVFMPAGQTDLPIAVVCHEFMTNRLFSYPYAIALAKCGYAAFCFDFCGGGILSGSDGDSRDMSVLTEKEDLKAVINFAAAQDYVDNRPLLLLGCSQGGLVAALIAAELQEKLGGLILQYPALSIPDAARKGEMLWMHFDSNNVPDEMRSGPMRIGKQYATDVMNIDTMQAIACYTGQVMIIHGDQDTLVDISGSQKAAISYESAGANVSLQIISGGGHIFFKPKEIKEAMNLVSKFAKKLNEGE